MWGEYFLHYLLSTLLGQCLLLRTFQKIFSPENALLFLLRLFIERYPCSAWSRLQPELEARCGVKIYCCNFGKMLVFLSNDASFTWSGRFSYSFRMIPMGRLGTGNPPTTRPLITQSSCITGRDQGSGRPGSITTHLHENGLNDKKNGVSRKRFSRATEQIGIHVVFHLIPLVSNRHFSHVTFWKEGSHLCLYSSTGNK
jgi:hypothetical protein